MRLLLASASPRRREILATLGLAFDVHPVDADESERPGEAPRAYLERVVGAKLALGRTMAEARGHDAVLVADTTVVLDGAMLAKPADAADNRRMVRRLAGRSHEVMTRFAVAATSGASHAETVVTRVDVRPLDDDAIAAYVATGEGRDKAGGYAIQGLGMFAVSRIEGSYTSVVGLPAAEVVAALRGLGLLARFPLGPAA
ncbi:MAG: septum formation protein Maf [Polyangiaceae bacterium]|nr:septum formation protein Maf [Polyangiaceae bacterium]